jgi:hypothetical protein
VPSPAIKLTAVGGYSFERRFIFFDATRRDLRLDDIPFFKLSLDIGW